MPVSPTYPGVYIEEIPSGVRTIVGVATSITAFIGTAIKGPVQEPTTINNFGDYERMFGGLSLDSTMSYAVRDFYLNGGSQAIIVRIENGAEPATITLVGEASPVDALVLEAASPGLWGNNLSAGVDYNTRDTTDTQLFNLTVQEGSGTPEKLFNVSMNSADPRYLPRFLEQNSLLVRVQEDSSGNPILPAGRPAQTVSATSPPTSPPTSLLDMVPSDNNGDDGSAPGTTDYTGSQSLKTGIFALDKADLFNLLCIPPPVRGQNTDVSVYQTAVPYCVARRAMLIVDPPVEWGARAETAASNARVGVETLRPSGTIARNAAIYFPMVVEQDPLRENQIDTFVPCGIVAGVMARTDAQRGVWKAPAGLEGGLNGIVGLQVNLTDDENGILNPLAVNCLRSFPVNGRVVWGARTLRGADQLTDEYKYVPVRRLALFLEESLYRGTQFAVFEPNDEPLWAQLRLNIGAFMQNLFRQGAFQGRSPREAYLVKVDSETTTQTDINLGIVNIVVGFAPLKPAEFVIIKIQQLAGQIAV